jgi:cation transport ATPase
MFDVEPQEQSDAEDAAEFERYAAKQLRKTAKDAAWAGCALLLCILCIVPFAAGHSFHRYWDGTKFLIYIAEALLVWFVIKVAFIWSAWQSARRHGVNSATTFSAEVLYAPAIIMPSTRIVGAALAPRKTRSLPMATIFLYMSLRFPAMVISSTG